MEAAELYSPVEWAYRRRGRFTMTTVRTALNVVDAVTNALQEIS
jgi:hypothetical protein